MEIIVTRNQLKLNSINRDIGIQDITLHHFIHECYVLFKKCDKVSFRDDDGTMILLKNRD